MTLKQIACAAALAALPVISQASTTFETEMLGLGPNDVISSAQDLGTLSASGITVFGSRIETLPGGTSVDFYQFFLSQAATVSFAVTAPTGYLSENDPIVGLFSSAGNLIAYDDDSGPGYDSLLTQGLSGGSYYVAVSGYSNFEFSGNSGNANWFYHLDLTSAAAVPEPESYALMLAGLGLMGTIARRRSKSKAV